MKWWEIGVLMRRKEKKNWKEFKERVRGWWDDRVWGERKLDVRAVRWDWEELRREWNDGLFCTKCGVWGVYHDWSVKLLIFLLTIYGLKIGYNKIITQIQILKLLMTTKITTQFKTTQTNLIINLNIPFPSPFKETLSPRSLRI